MNGNNEMLWFICHYLYRIALLNDEANAVQVGTRDGAINLTLTKLIS